MSIVMTTISARLPAPPISETTEHLLRVRASLPDGHPDRFAIRTQVIEAHLQMSRRLARRYANRGEPLDDLAQVAALGLVKAVDGFDSDRNTPFLAYAIPTIIGVLKRHFRDSGWTMKVPRPMQEMMLLVRTTTADLSQRGQTPTITVLAEHLQMGPAEISAAMLASNMYRPDSLDAPGGYTGGPPDGDPLRSLGATDHHYADVDNQLSFRTLIAAMPPNQRRALTLRFFHDMTQTRIAAEMGVSQMQVSRVLKQSLARLRQDLLASMADGGRPGMGAQPVRAATP
jgi:RNA polymerase sigma-B factor